VRHPPPRPHPPLATPERTRKPTGQQAALTPPPVGAPDIKISVRQTFGIDSYLEVPGFSQPSEHVPDMDDAYRFDRDTTLAILAGFVGVLLVMHPRFGVRRTPCLDGRHAGDDIPADGRTQSGDVRVPAGA